MISPKVLYKSSQYLVVNKPYDIKINSDNAEDITLETKLLERGIRCTDESDKPPTHSFYWIHRLDFATSGVLCIGLTKNAARKACQAFEKRLVRKFYVALVRGIVDLEKISESHSCVQLLPDEVPHLDIHASLVRDRTTDFPYIFTTFTADSNSNILLDTNSTSKASNDKVLSASTSVYVLETGLYEGESASKLLLVPHTGRSHQLRVHCKYIGHTIIGDYTYSNRQDFSPHRMMLHAYSLHMPDSIEDFCTVATDEPFIQDTKWVTQTKYRQLDFLVHALSSTK